MRKVILSLLVSLLLAGAADSFAQSCPNITGPHYWGTYTYYDYTSDRSCYATSGNVSNTTTSCLSYDGWAFGMGWTNVAEFTFTVGSQVIDPTKWQAFSYIEFDDPNDDGFNRVELVASVRHANNSIDNYPLFFWTGGDGDLNGCSAQGGYFTADTGDEVTIRVNSTKWYTNTVIKASVPVINSGNF